eukprot:10002716-Karenia_brevis.AAC.1
MKTKSGTGRGPSENPAETGREPCRNRSRTANSAGIVPWDRREAGIDRKGRARTGTSEIGEEKNRRRPSEREPWELGETGREPNRNRQEPSGSRTRTEREPSGSQTRTGQESIANGVRLREPRLGSFGSGKEPDEQSESQQEPEGARIGEEPARTEPTGTTGTGREPTRNRREPNGSRATTGREPSGNQARPTRGGDRSRNRREL